MNNKEIIERWYNSPYTEEDKICRHKGEECHHHKKYNGKEVIPYEERRENRLLRIIDAMLNECRADMRSKIAEQIRILLQITQEVG